jgi:pSer/pThr/pTyr-binding forkhead associated (FHA) protein
MVLVFTSQPRAGEVVDIEAAKLTIGRVAGNDLELPDEKVSRHHAVIEVQDGGRALLRDLGSRNGTFVDGRRISGSCLLRGGEQLRLGDQQLRVEVSPPRAAGPSAEPVGEPSEALAPVAAAPAAAAPARAARADERRGRMRGLRGRRGALALAAGVALAAALVFGVGQLVLPGVAEQRLRSQLSRYGPVRVAKLESAPAIKLLWHKADSVRVAMDSYRSEPGGHGSLADFLSRTRDTGKLDVSVGTLRAQLVTLHQVRLHKEGDLLVGEALLTQRELSAALPSFIDLRPVSASANGIVVKVGATVLGRHVAERLGVVAQAGKVVVRPEGLPFGSLATITVFNDPRVYVESLGAELNGAQYRLTVRARLR